MKEVTLHLEDNIIASIDSEAKQLGLTREEMLKYAVGMFAITVTPPKLFTAAEVPGFAMTPLKTFPGFPFGGPMDQVGSVLVHAAEEAGKMMLRVQARAGTLKCRACTLPLTEEDVDNGFCRSCKSPILPPPKDEQGGEEEAR